ncbi:MAG: 2-hydroxychromene-2-carboxylate isomerase [Alphaproteobacteria bacterium]|jgi:2-hydroxychromene-2-carboxylate isomerase
MSKSVEYFMSLASPYSYMGGRRLPQIIEDTGATFHIKPVIGPKIMAATGGLPVAKRHPARLAYRLVELDRWKRHWSLPMNIQPKFFPVDDHLAAHMVIAAQQAGLDAIALSNIFLACVWEGEQDISDQATLVAAATQAGFDGAAMAAHIDTVEIIAAHQANTDEAIGHQVFGMPWFIHDGVPYWGQDRIRFLAKALRD